MEVKILMLLCVVAIVYLPIRVMIISADFAESERVKYSQSKIRQINTSTEIQRERDKRQQETAWRIEKEALIIEWQAEKARQRRIESGRRAIDRAIEMEMAA